MMKFVNGKNVILVTTILMLLIAPSISLPAATMNIGVTRRAGVDAPQWNVGDTWVYNINVKGRYYNELELNVNIKEVRFEVISNSGSEYKVNIDGSVDAQGSYKGFSGGMNNGRIEGGTITVRKTDLAITGLDNFKASGQASVMGIPLPISASGIVSLSELVPVNYLTFPLDVGTTWTRNEVSALLYTKVTVGSLIDEEYTFSIYQVQNNLRCVGKESVSVSGSSFECYKIVGDMGSSSTIWYSPDLGNIAKAEFRDIDLYFEKGYEEHYDIDYVTITCTGYGRRSNPPQKPSPPSGPSQGDIGKDYTFTAVSIDPDGDKIKYIFDWGDEKTSETSFVPSGQSASASHRWNNAGRYEVRVKAVDTNGAESDWSDPAYIDISGERGSVNITIKILKIEMQDKIDPWYKGGADWSYRVSVFDGDGWISRMDNCPDNRDTYEPRKSYTFSVKTGSPIIKIKLWDRDFVIKNPLGGYIDYHDLADVSSYQGNGVKNGIPEERGAIYHGTYKIGEHQLQTTVGENNDNVNRNGNVYITSGSFDGSGDAFNYDAQITFEITDDYEPLRNVKIISPASGSMFYTGQKIEFKAKAEKGLMPYRWRWDFGDGSSSDKQNPIKIYHEEGDYFVRVTVTDEAGSSLQSDPIIVKIRKNSPPTTPSKPQGPTSPKVGEMCTYRTVASDYEGDGIAYGWDWNGDGVVDEWNDKDGVYYISGETCATDHAWSSSGVRKVKVKARDETGLESGWSEELIVVVKKTRSIVSRNLLFEIAKRFYSLNVLSKLFIK